MRIYATVDSVLFTGYNWKELQLWKSTDCRVIRMRQASDSAAVSQEKREGQAYEQKDYFNGGSPHRTSSCGPLCRLFEGACKTAEFRSV